ncbi:acyl-CoA thioesterase [Pedobacter sp. SYSU D00535]|uniref:acyl-CoA thioesterase n=1 Tax=Pedobacter sp. SYSU D00535 TaxID=2810308 RepID=UPI001A958FC1|nr:acyl-CoA thioesterase [Pedobacter sp. SYSU D00535]
MLTKDFKPVRYSETIITELMVPSYANFEGNIHGGIILSLMDKVAYVCAAKHSNSYCVTASIDAVDFLAPIAVGELVSFHASVNYVGKTSVVVGIRVVAENVKTHSVKHTNISYFTMVAIGDNNKPTTVPGLILENQKEVIKFIEAIKRKRLKQEFKNSIADVSKSIDIEMEKQLLTTERCIIASGCGEDVLSAIYTDSQLYQEEYRLGVH